MLILYAKNELRTQRGLPLLTRILSSGGVV
jgi:hypothetical protein